MSRVAQTELIEGDVADAASFNDTLTSWNAATAAGQVSKDNVTEEGLDLRVFNVGAIKRPYQSTDRFTGGTLGTNGFTTVSAVYVPVNITTDAKIGPFDISATNRRLRVRASFLVRCATAGQTVAVRLAQGTDGVTFAGVTSTERFFQARNANTPYSIAALEQSCTISTRVIGVSATTYLRLEVYVTGGATASVNCVSLYGEVFNK